MQSPEHERQERQREQRNREEHERQKKKPTSTLPKHAVNGECAKFARAELKRRRNKGGCCTYIAYRTEQDISKAYFSSIWTHVGLFGPANISQNGFHVGVVCGNGKTPNFAEVVHGNTSAYDNNFLFGTTGAFWVDGAYRVFNPLGYAGGVAIQFRGYAFSGAFFTCWKNYNR